jgi:hypothetical protein
MTNQVYFAKLHTAYTPTRGEVQPVLYFDTEWGKYGISGTPCRKIFHRLSSEDVERLQAQLAEMNIVPLNFQDPERSHVSKLVDLISGVKSRKEPIPLNEPIPKEQISPLLRLFGETPETAFIYS